MGSKKKIEEISLSPSSSLSAPYYERDCGWAKVPSKIWGKKFVAVDILSEKVTTTYLVRTDDGIIFETTELFK